VALRVPNGEGEARRIEHRIAGADANPYLNLAAILAGILYGIENKLEADPPTTGGPTDDDPILPGNWFESLRAFENSEFVAKWMGEDFQEAFMQMKHAEQLEFTGAVNPFEYNTYLVMA
jgi:glutamine synthetase